MSLLKAVEVCIENGARWKALNAFTNVKDHATIKAAAAVADSRANSSAFAYRLCFNTNTSGSHLSPIDGRLIGIKDNICTKDLPTTCASNALAGFRSPCEATVIRKLEAAGAIIAGKTNLDAFGMGSHSTNSTFGPVFQDTVGKHSAGGSSGGSAVAVATSQCWASIGTDTGGSVRLPAAYTGIFGFKPSYGVISRFGVVPYANSLDTVGILGRKVSDIQQVFEVLRGSDSRDPTSLAELVRSKLATTAGQRRPDSRLRVGVPVEYNTQELQPVIRTAWQQALSKLSRDGHVVMPVSLPSTKLALPAYYVLAPAEASSNLAKYDGVRYGKLAASMRGEHDVLFASCRGENLSEEVRKRILLGSFTLSASAIDNYFIQAQRIRRLVQSDFDAVFAFENVLVDGSSTEAGGVDVLLAPTAPSLPPCLADLAQRNPLDSYRDDVLTVPASLAGLPAISIPTNTKGIVQEESGFIGLQLIGQFGDDDFILHTAGRLSESLWTR